MEKKYEYIVPNCEVIEIKSNYAVMDLVLSVFDEETEIVGAKSGDFSEDTEEDVFGSKSKNLWDE